MSAAVQMMTPGLRRTCFYCPTVLVLAPADRDQLNGATRDHLFPRVLVRTLAGTAPERWYCRNKVWCCAGCNRRKKCMHPLEWAWTLDETHQARVLNRVREMDALAPSLLWNVRVAGPDHRPEFLDASY